MDRCGTRGCDPCPRRDGGAGSGPVAAGPSGSPGLWAGDAWGPEISQRLAGPYTFIRVLHGAGFYGLLRVVATAQPVGARAIVAGILESAWEVIENSEMVIERYRATTASQGTGGTVSSTPWGTCWRACRDSSLAARLPTRVTVIGAIGVEILLAASIRDGLLLNVLRLIYPINAVRTRQLGFP